MKTPRFYLKTASSGRSRSPPVLVVPLIHWDVRRQRRRQNPKRRRRWSAWRRRSTTELAPRALGAGQRDQPPATRRWPASRTVASCAWSRSGSACAPAKPLAVLDDTALDAAANDEGEADLARIQAQLDMAARQEQRYAQLAAQQNIARAQYEQLRADRDMLVQERARAQALLAQTRHQPHADDRARAVRRRGGRTLGATGRIRRTPAMPVARLVDTDAQEVRVRAPVDLAATPRRRRAGQVRVGRNASKNERAHPRQRAGAGRRRSLAPARTSHRHGQRRVARRHRGRRRHAGRTQARRRRGAARRGDPAPRGRLRAAGGRRTTRPSGCR